MKRVLAIAAGALALAVPAAQAHTTIIEPPESHYPYQWWVDEAKVPTPSEEITVVEDASPCEDAEACTEDGAQVIWFGANVVTPRLRFYHELGHNFAYSASRWVRHRYAAIIGAPWTRVGERFAESYAFCAIRPRIRRGAGVAGQEPVGGWRVHNRVCRLLRKLG